MIEHTGSRRREGPGRAGRIVFPFVCLLIVVAFLLGARANLVADSVDYYLRVQRLVAPEDPPIVTRAPFADQRSPGYGLLAALLHVGLETLVAPLGETVTVQIPEREDPRRPGPRTIPDRPYRLLEVPFRDVVTGPGSGRLRWTILLALGLTSLAFLVAGLIAVARALRRLHPARPWTLLAPAVVVGSPALLTDLFVRPFYATFAAFGACGLFTLFLVRAETGRRWNAWPAGFFLGLLVLVRIEIAVLAVGAGLALLAFRRTEILWRLTIGASWALPAWLVHDQVAYGSPIHLGILRGDINRIAVDPDWIGMALLHPASGILVWSPLVIVGLVGLGMSRSPTLRAFAIGAGALIILYLLRVPIMAGHVGGVPIVVDGLAVDPPRTRIDLLGLVRSDMNRYVGVLAPLAAVGLRELGSRLRRGRPAPASRHPGSSGRSGRRASERRDRDLDRQQRVRG